MIRDENFYHLIIFLNDISGVELWTDTITDENGDYKAYDDFDEPYVYMHKAEKE